MSLGIDGGQLNGLAKSRGRLLVALSALQEVAQCAAQIRSVGGQHDALLECKLGAREIPRHFLGYRQGHPCLVGLGILTGILPMLYPERGVQMSFMVQALVLLISGVYYSTDVLPGWLQAASHLSPATYMLSGIRSALLDGAGLSKQVHNLVVLGVLGLLMIPLSLVAFHAAETWAKKTGRLKRQG